PFLTISLHDSLPICICYNTIYGINKIHLALHGHHLNVDRLDYLYLRVCECLLQTNLHTIPIRYQTHYKARIHLQEKHLQVQYLNSHPILHYELETYLAISYNNAHHQASTHLPRTTDSPPYHFWHYIPPSLQYTDVYQPTYKKRHHHTKTHVLPDVPFYLVYSSHNLPDNSIHHILQPPTRAKLVP